MARTEEEQKGISLLGNQHVAYPSDYSADTSPMCRMCAWWRVSR